MKISTTILKQVYLVTLVLLPQSVQSFAQCTVYCILNLFTVQQYF